MDSRTMKGNSPWAARLPPTTLGVTPPPPPGSAAAGAAIVVATMAAAAAVARRVRHLRIIDPPRSGYARQGDTASRSTASVAFKDAHVHIPGRPYHRGPRD